MTGKKLAREQSSWAAKPRGRRRVRPHVRHAADRAIIQYVAAAVGLVILLVIIGQSL
jgi:hypothetical protein